MRRDRTIVSLRQHQRRAVLRYGLKTANGQKSLSHQSHEIPPHKMPKAKRRKVAPRRTRYEWPHFGWFRRFCKRTSFGKYGGLGGSGKLY